MNCVPALIIIESYQKFQASMPTCTDFLGNMHVYNYL